VFCWAVLRAPAGKLLAAVLPELVPMLRDEKALDITDAQADLLGRMSAATIDRRLTGERAKLLPRGRSHTKPGSLLKSQIPIRTWAQWDDAVPGFVEIDLVGHEGSNSSGQYCSTLTVTDISTGWTVDSDNGGELINNDLFDFCQEHRITFTRSRLYNKNDGAHVEQKNWSRVRELVGYLRYDTAAELELLNQIWELDRIFTNYLLPQQKLVSKTRRGARVTKIHDAPATPHRRAAADAHTDRKAVTRMKPNTGKSDPRPCPGKSWPSPGNSKRSPRPSNQHQSDHPSTRTGTAGPTGGFPMTQRIPLRGGIDMRQQGAFDRQRLVMEAHEHPGDCLGEGGGDAAFFRAHDAIGNAVLGRPRVLVSRTKRICRTTLSPCWRVC
jgi:hypothetical protein